MDSVIVEIRERRKDGAGFPTFGARHKNGEISLNQSLDVLLFLTLILRRLLVMKYSKLFIKHYFNLTLDNSGHASLFESLPCFTMLLYQNTS